MRPGEGAIRRIALVTTADASGDRDEELRRLFASVAAFRAARPEVPVEHRLLLQRCDDVSGVAARVGIPPEVIVSAINRQVPLSIARNIVLDTILASDAIDDALVAFPDDDAWYPEGVLEHVYDAFLKDPRLDLWFCRYGSDAQLNPSASARVPSLQQVLSFGSSNTLFLRGALLRGIGGFDEKLGLGTPARSGEDTEFAMRTFLAARTVAFVDARMVGHRDFSREIRARYFAGSLVAIRRHSHRSVAGQFAYWRKLAVGVALTLKGELSLTGLREAASLLRSNRAPVSGSPDRSRASDIRLPPIHASAPSAISASDYQE